MTETSAPLPLGPAPAPVAARPSGARASDELALAHWTTHHRVFVCSLRGGTGCTTVAGLIALTLAGLPYSQVHPPVRLAERRPEPLSGARRRWGARLDSDDIPVTRAGGFVQLVDDVGVAGGHPSIVDAGAGLSTMVSVATDQPTASLVLVTRPDRTSLADTAEALVWLEDRHGVHHDRTTVVINHGSGHPDRGSRSAAAALWIRCASVHTLSAHRALGPGRTLPSGDDVPGHLCSSMIELCLDIYRTNRPVADAADASQEDPHA